MQLAGQAVDEVRKDLIRGGADLKGALWALRGNEWNLNEEQNETRARLSEQYEPLGTALGLRSALQDIFYPGLPAAPTCSGNGVTGLTKVSLNLS